MEIFLKKHIAVYKFKPLNVKFNQIPHWKQSLVNIKYKFKHSNANSNIHNRQGIHKKSLLR